jgi:hypothetical protein
VTTGSIFWLTIIMLANFISFEMKRFKPSFGSACVLQFKKCIEFHNFEICASSLYNCGNIDSADYRNFTMPNVIEDVPVMKITAQNFSANDNIANRNMCKFNAKNDQRLCEVLCQTDSFDLKMSKECLQEGLSIPSAKLLRRNFFSCFVRFLFRKKTLSQIDYRCLAKFEALL